MSWSAGLLLVGFVVAWHQRLRLLEWLATPAARALRNLPPQPFDPPLEFFSFYVYSATAAGFLLALPTLVRLVCAFVAVTPSIRAKLANPSFVGASYFAVILGLLSAQNLVLPWLAVRTLVSDGTGSYARSLTSSYLPLAVVATVGLILLLELCAVVATLSLPRWSPYDSSLQQTPRS